MRDEMSVAIVPLLFMSAAELFLSDASRRSQCQLSRPPDITYKAAVGGKFQSVAGSVSRANVKFSH